jgi:nucleoside 2-deoxyribosyltransferase
MVKYKSIYIIGSLKNIKVPELANNVRKLGIEAFDDWYSPGPDTDDYWKVHEQLRGRSYKEALNGWHAKDVFEFDKKHLDRCDAAVLILPAGKSGHLELGYTVGRNKPGWIILDNSDRWDIMYQFATDVFNNENEFLEMLKNG